MRKLIVKNLYSEKNTHLGGVAKFGYLHLPMHSELYFTKQIKQGFKFFKIPFKVTTSIEMVQVPVEIVSLFGHLLEEGEGFNESFSFESYRAQTRKIANEVRSRMKESIGQSSELNEDDKLKIYQQIKEDEKYLDNLLVRPNKYEERHLKTFLLNNYELVYRTGLGTTKTYYMARVLDDRISMYAIDLIGLKDGELLLANVKAFYVTERYMREFLKTIKEKGENLQ